MPAGAKQAVGVGRPLEAWAIESARDYAGLSRDELASRLNETLTPDRPYTYDSIREMERGLRRRASFAEVSTIATITGFPISWFQSNPVLIDSQSGWYGDPLPAGLDLAAA